MIRLGYALITTHIGATIHVTELDTRYVGLTIRGQRFEVEDLKQLRKFLKKLQRQLEGNDKDDFGGVSI